MGDLATVVNSLGGAASALFQSKGSAAQAADYYGAAQLAEQNAQLSAASTRIQETQVARSVTQSLGTTQADIAGAGFTLSGSALDIMRDSARQGALAKTLVNIQGAINENSYAAQAGAYTGEAKAANEAADANKVNAIASIGGALLSGTGQLASAGKTVAKGFDYVNNLFSGGIGYETSAAEPTAAALFSQDEVAAAAQQAFSATDSGLAAGASIGSTDFTVDTSLIPFGTSSDVASSAISDAISSGLSDVSQALPYVGLGASIYEDITHPSVGSFLSTAAAVATIAFSVICTAFYRRKMVTRAEWIGAQRYGAQLDPRTFAGYVFWAAPIAHRIEKYEWFARLMAPIFIPPVREMAVQMGQPGTKSSAYGFFSHRILLSLSWLIGRTINKRGKYVFAGT